MYEWARFIFRLVNGSTDRHLGKPELGGSELLSGKTDTCPPRLRMGRSDSAAFREQKTCISSRLSIFGINQDIKHGTNSRPFRCRDSANRPKKVQLLRSEPRKNQPQRKMTRIEEHPKSPHPDGRAELRDPY